VPDVPVQARRLNYIVSKYVRGLTTINYTKKKTKSSFWRNSCRFGCCL